MFVLSQILIAQSDVDIDSYISEIKSAPAAERVKLMNEFKRHVAQMNQEERLHILHKMQLKMQSQQHNEIHIQQQMSHREAEKQFFRGKEHTLPSLPKGVHP